MNIHNLSRYLRSLPKPNQQTNRLPPTERSGRSKGILHLRQLQLQVLQSRVLKQPKAKAVLNKNVGNHRNLPKKRFNNPKCRNSNPLKKKKKAGYSSGIRNHILNPDLAGRHLAIKYWAWLTKGTGRGCGP